jgi:hypothetical protein
VAFQLTRVASQPGVQRDGTPTAAQAYTDAQWARWQRGLPRKMGGYKNTQPYLTAVSRALYSQAAQGFRYISSGNPFGVDEFTIDNTGVASGVINPPFPVTVNPTTTGLPTGSVGTQPFTQVNSWQFESQFDNQTGINLLFAFCGQNLIDPTNTNNFPLYCTSIYSPVNWTYSGAYASGVPAYWSNTPTAETGFVQVPGFATGTIAGFAVGNNSYQALFPNGISGGICSLAPYMTVFGNDGFLAWSAPGFPTDFIGGSQGSLYVGATRITNQKILKGFPLRGGGGYSPNGLYWSVDSLVRATFVGIPNGTFQFDQITTQSSVLSDRCIIENDGTFYWAGVDRFLKYNGVMQEIPNDKNLNWFYDGINPLYAAKAFAMKIPRYGEIWWCYPRGTATECTHAVIYNFRENCWYDTVLPPTGRSSGLHADNFVGNIMGDPTPQNVQIALQLTSVATSSGGSAVYTGNITGGAGNALAGQTFTVSGFVATPANNGTFLAAASSATTLTLNNASAVAESHAATATSQPPSTFNLWQHEQGTDQILGTQQTAVLSSFTTAPFSSFDSDPPHDDGITLGILQPDFIQSGAMVVNVLKQNNATDQVYAGTSATIPDPLTVQTGTASLGQVVPLKDTAKLIRLQFVSNTNGGNYQMGRTMIEIQSDGDRDT